MEEANKSYQKPFKNSNITVVKEFTQRADTTRMMEWYNKRAIEILETTTFPPELDDLNRYKELKKK